MLPFEFSSGAASGQSEVLAIRALGFITSTRSGLNRLLAHSRLGEADFRRRPIAAEHLAAVLDFIITDEALLVAFAGAVEVSPETLYEARRLLRLAPAFAQDGIAPPPASGWQGAASLAGAQRR